MQAAQSQAIGSPEPGHREAESSPAASILNQATGGPESGHWWPRIRPLATRNKATGGPESSHQATGGPESSHWWPRVKPPVAQNQATDGPESGHWRPSIRPWSCIDVDVVLMVLLVFFCFGKPHGAQLQWLCATHRARFCSRACFR